MTATLAKTAILVMIVTVVTTVTHVAAEVVVTTASVRNAMTVVGRNAPPTGNAPGRPIVAQKSRIVAPGRLPLRGILMIGGLQGTMIDEDHMMSGEALTFILIAAGTTDGARRRTIGSRTGPPERTEITVGRDEDTMVLQDSTRSSWTANAFQTFPKTLLSRSGICSAPGHDLYHEEVEYSVGYCALVPIVAGAHMRLEVQHTRTFLPRYRNPARHSRAR